MRNTLPHRPIVALDIDGTIGRYHEHFLWFARLYTGREDLTLDWERPGVNGEFNKAMRMAKSTYREIKLAYRQGGMKRCMPVFPHASELTKVLRKEGAEVWICTTRPYLRLDNIDPDTRHFLKRQKIQFDGVLYGEHKYRDLVSIVGTDRVVAVLDDLPEQVESARRAGLPPIMRVGDHNAWWRNARDLKDWGQAGLVGAGSLATIEGIPVADDLGEAGYEIKHRIKNWKETRS